MADTTYHRTYGDDSGYPTTRTIYAPPDITTGLLADWNADTLGTVGTDVTSFANSAGSLGSAANLTSFSTSKPTVVAGPNGHKAVRAVKGSSQYMRTALFASPIGLPMTQVLVLKRNDTGTQSIVSGHFTSSSSFIGMNWQTAGYGAGAGASGEVINGYANTDASNFHIVAVRHGSNASLYVDSVSSSGVTGVANPTLANLPRVTFFANSAATSQFASFDLARAMFFGRGLTNNDLESLILSLKTTYGIA